MAYDNGTVRVAKDNLRAHVDKFIDEEQTALEHLLVEEHRSACLSSHRNEHGEQVRSQSWPRRIGNGHGGTVDERLNLVVALARHKEVVILDFHLDAHATEGIGNDAEVLERHVFDADAVTTHGCQADERTHLNHVRQNGVFRAMQLANTLDGEQVRCNAADACAHAVEHLAELLQIGLAGSIVNGSRALCHHSRHDNVGRTRHRGFVEQHIAAFQFLGDNLEHIAPLHLLKTSTQFLEAQEVGV